jgi:hypothetical protein
VTSTLYEGRRARRPAARLTTEVVLASIGAVLLGIALFANQRWLDKHFLPSFFIARESYVLLESLARLAIALLGISLAVFVRAPAGRFVERGPARVVHIGFAVLLAVFAGELVLRYVHLVPAEWLGRDQEPRRRVDALLGWTFEPSRSGHSTIGGRTIEYAFDRSGYRVRRVDESVDPSLPTILFIGESLMFGKGLTWEESVPALVGATTRTQSANLAVDGYGNDQAYLRLKSELLRFERPVAVVTIFMTTLFGRNLDDDRPHLSRGLIWLPGVRHTRLRSFVGLVAPYRTEETVERGIAVTRDVLRATIGLAAARGAAPLILVPQIGPDDRVQRMLRTRILDEPGLPYVLVDIDPAWRVPGDVHPDAHGARVIAAAVTARLPKP